jgi:hypothetical protein
VARGREPVSEHLDYMAQLIARRQVRSMDAAARKALVALGKVATIRTLTRRYSERQRELEVQVMREIVEVTITYGVRFGAPEVKAHFRIPDEWEARVRQLESLEASEPDFAALALSMLPADLAPYRNRLRNTRTALLHLWHPAELIPLLEKGGFPLDPDA